MISHAVATVYIPSMLRPLAGDRETVDVKGSSVREIVEGLMAMYPKMGGRLLDGTHLRSSISVAIDGEISTLGMLDSVEKDSEIHFIHAIAGGLTGTDADPLG